MISHQKLSMAALIGCSSLFLLCSVLQPISAAKGYREPCSSNGDCITNYCHRTSKTCECGTSKDYDKGGKKSEQIFDKELQMCFSRIGHMCTLDVEPSADNNGNLHLLRCIPDGSCAPVSKSQAYSSNQIFGRCTCKNGFQPFENGKRCISNVELRTDQAPAAMDQVIAGWKRSGGSSSIIVNRSYTMYYSAFAVIVLCSMFTFR